MSIGGYLKKHTEALVKDVGIEAACDLTGKSKATLGRYYSDQDEHADRFMPIDVVALVQRFGMLMAEYNQAIGDGKISVNEAKRLLRETLAIQQVLLEMKLNLEDEAGA